MFQYELMFALAKRKSRERVRRCLQLGETRLWGTKERCARGVSVPGRAIYAQNDVYLETCNPIWELTGFRTFQIILVIPVVVAVWLFWYGLGVHPLFTGNTYLFGQVDPIKGDEAFTYAMGWLLCFPSAITFSWVAYIILVSLGGTFTMFFSPLRGRIRFNRITRKVYVLRPSYAGGNRVFDWDRLQAIVDWLGYSYAFNENDIRNKRTNWFLVLYHPPTDPENPHDEDAIMVGCESIFSGDVPRWWEYIRRYMEYGPSVDRIRHGATANYSRIVRNVPQEYTTLCGKPNLLQLDMETGVGMYMGIFHLLSQATCWWPRFPKEWQSDGGLGEPEDRPVQTGATITALFYREQGTLSPEDHARLLEIWGTPEARAEFAERQAKERAESAAGGGAETPKPPQAPLGN